METGSFDELPLDCPYRYAIDGLQRAIASCLSNDAQPDCLICAKPLGDFIEPVLSDN